ncbi:MAG: hypothetical protein L6R40_008711 [Gallowayella cf. fulva]|nr:MAG: hypothetical protein L6R40_008711 [Xanthomendoza cf. fulva]
MANLSQGDRNIIAEHSLDKWLDHLRDPLRRAEQNNKPGSPLHDGIVNRPDQGPQKAISRLLGALQVHEVALDLRSKIGDSDIASELSELFKRVRSGRYNYEHYRALLRLVVKQASDVDIWNAVFELIATVSRTTPPTSIPVSFDGTPITISSSSFQGSEQTRRIIESAMFYEIKGCTYRDVDGFFEKYFEGRRWSHKTEAIYNAVSKKCTGGRWTDFPDPPDEDAMWDWLSRFQDEHLSDSRGSTGDLAGGEAQRQLDLFVKRRGIETSGKHDWKDVRVIGELKRSKWTLKKILLQLARYIRDAFTAQPTRRFIHGFVLHETTMELWVFDRSGPYSSGEFDIHKEPEKFIRAIAGYAMMDDEELGLDTFTELDDRGRFITISEDATGRRIGCGWMRRHSSSNVRLCVEAQPASAAVVKFSWTSDKRPPEADHLRLAREKGVEGIAKLIGYQRITSISELRSGLTFPSPHRFRDGTTSATTSFFQTQLSQSFGPIQNLSISKTSSKRKHAGDERGNQKRSRSDSQKSKLSQEYEAAQKPSEPAVSLYESDNGQYSNRIFGCLAIAPAGRALNEFAQRPQSTDSVPSAIRELLTTLRDAIKAHRSLYLKGNILHRDISENNIIITNPKESGGFTGMLIDLDLAKVLGSGRSGARHQTGTMEFMAIEVLLGIDHTYRHDLESFFYVLIWLCARRGWNFCGHTSGRSTESVLTKWYSGSFKDIAEAKRGYMHVDGFEDILDEFPTAFDSVKPLCRKIRGILFPLLEDGALFKGTRPDPPEKLYDPIIEAFEDAIEDS